MRKLTLFGALTFLLLGAGFVHAFQYPDDTKFSAVPVIEIEQLLSIKDTTLILDVRSGPEFNTAHIEGAEHCKVSSRSFLKKAQALMSKHGKKKVVTYCNGQSCLKAPAAAEQLLNVGIDAVALFDGIPGWANAYPALTVLRGKPISVDNQLIPKSEFMKKCLTFDEFKNKASEENTMVIDIRDKIQASGKLPLGNIKVISIPLDRFIPNFVVPKQNQNKTLLIFDQVGKQAQSLEYDLKENGYIHYYFLKKGATKVLGKQIYKN